MINLILFGPPGSGKGTQAVKLAKKFKLIHISTGDLFRYELGNDTPLGQKAKDYIAKGELVPDEVTIGMLRNKVEAHPEAKGFIFDGFPRTVNQAAALDALLQERRLSVSALIALDVPEEEIVSRIKMRGEISGRADDQDEGITRNRIKVYQNETAPVYDYYDKQGKSRRINGTGSILAIFRRLCKLISSIAS